MHFGSPKPGLNPAAHLAAHVLDPKKIKQEPTRNGYGTGLLKAAARDPRVVALCADLSESTRTLPFAEKYPARFVQMGVSEQSLVSVAAGMAAAGKIPFVASYAMFCPGRAWEQVRTNAALNEMPVKIAGAHSGVSVGPDGATHQAIEDIAIMRVLPRMTVLAPCDVIETEKATLAAAAHSGPVYFRFAREKTPVFTTDKTPFAIGKAIPFRFGSDVAIMGCGPVLYHALLAAEQLAKKGIQATVLNCGSIKPLDTRTVIEYARLCGAVVTIEEHQRAGGLGSAITEVLAEHHPVPVFRLGVDDQFGESGTPDELIKKFGLTPADVVAAALQAVKVKRAL